MASVKAMPGKRKSRGDDALDRAKSARLDGFPHVAKMTEWFLACEKKLNRSCCTCFVQWPIHFKAYGHGASSGRAR